MRSGSAWRIRSDNLWINRAYLRISDYCRLTVRARARARVRVRVRVSIRFRLGLVFRIVVHKLPDKVTKCASAT